MQICKILYKVANLYHKSKYIIKNTNSFLFSFLSIKKSMQSIPLRSELFHGTYSLEYHDEDNTVQPWRILEKDRDLYYPDLLRVAAMPACCRIVIVTDASKIELQAFPLLPLTPYDYDLNIDGELVQTICKDPIINLDVEKHFKDEIDFTKPPDIKTIMSPKLITKFVSLTRGASAVKMDKVSPHTITFDLPGKNDGKTFRVEIWLSTCGSQKIKSLKVNSDATVISAFDDPRPVWVTHGSSITHNQGLGTAQIPGFPYGIGEAKSPSQSWPAMVAKKANLNLFSIGLGGQCHMDQMIARQIRDMKRVDCISLKLGINIHNLGSMAIRAFQQAAVGFVSTIRDKHPTVPILIISPIYGSFREHETHSPAALTPSGAKPDPRFPTLEQMRAILKSVVNIFIKRGDKNISYLSGLELFHEQDMKDGFMPDELHPTADGYLKMAERLAPIAFGRNGLLLPRRIIDDDSGSSSKL